MALFDPSRYGPLVAALLSEPRLMPLGPGTPNETARKRLEGLTAEGLFPGQPVGDSDMAKACLAGLWLYNDFLDQSHQLSQSIETGVGSYWHGLMHRREPDFANARYWFRRVGNHPVFEELAAQARGIAGETDLPAPARFLAGQTTWDPFAFIDLCEASLVGNPQLEALCRRIQQQEWELLFEHSYRAAVAPTA
jgi:hypothetical protein